MGRIARWSTVLAACLVAGGPANAAESVLANALRAVMEENVRAYSAEDLAAVQATMHSRSPEQEATARALPEQFRDHDVQATLVDFRFLGHDDEFAVARVKIRYQGAPNSGFNDNVTDSIVVFHDEGGRWKLWSDDILGVDFQGRPGAGSETR
jgi:hypothetical protein